jgi:hypothetical protein
MVLFTLDDRIVGRATMTSHQILITFEDAYWEWPTDER